jgi:hypothetical protein
MEQHIRLSAIVARDRDEAIGFDLLEGSLLPEGEIGTGPLLGSGVAR